MEQNENCVAFTNSIKKQTKMSKGWMGSGTPAKQAFIPLKNRKEMKKAQS